MTRVTIEDLEFYCSHGVSPEERAIGHRYAVTVSVLADERASKTDDVRDTVDYGEIASVVESVMKGDACQTMERLALKIAEQLLSRFERVQRAEVNVAKIAPPIPHVAARASAEVFLERS